jgi:hypothetical protein
MRYVLAAVLLLFATGTADAQIPPEWETAAQVVIDEIERDTPAAGKAWTVERREGWTLARAWRQHNNGNTEIILAEYLTFTLLCREAGCTGNRIAGKGYLERAGEVRALIGRNGGSYGLERAVHAWLAGLDDPTGAAARNAAMWSEDPDKAAADFATANIYALDWLLARTEAGQGAQAAAFARYALFVQGKAWIARRCLDISKVATLIGTPPRVGNCS